MYVSARRIKYAAPYKCSVACVVNPQGNTCTCIASLLFRCFYFQRSEFEQKHVYGTHDWNVFFLFFHVNLSYDKAGKPLICMDLQCTIETKVFSNTVWRIAQRQDAGARGRLYSELLRCQSCVLEMLIDMHAL